MSPAGPAGSVWTAACVAAGPADASDDASVAFVVAHSADGAGSADEAARSASAGS